MTRRIALSALLILVAVSGAIHAQIPSDRLLRAADEPQNWITYSGGYASQRHSTLTQITPGNVKNLELKWILPNQVFGAWQSSPIVVDEVVGYLVTMMLVPFSWRAVAAGFVAFRVFDVLKPWPASAFDRVKTGFGVVMDDVAAGVWASLALAALRALGVLP